MYLSRLGCCPRSECLVLGRVPQTKLIWLLRGSYQELDQDFLISVCSIIEGAPKVDAKGI